MDKNLYFYAYGKRKFTKEEKLQIIKEASQNGVNPTLEKYGVYRASYHSWKKELEEMGEEGF
ncbi:MAG: transposase [Bacteroidales bacterium]|nr:transposase [Bacteroidales bacterium]MBP9512718.1 transposase [Bacteroidales bacterium]